MRLCRCCKFYVYIFDIHTCAYHRSIRTFVSPVNGNKYDIVDTQPNIPSRMRDSTEFKIRRWRNCGIKAKFWKKKEKVDV